MTGTKIARAFRVSNPDERLCLSLAVTLLYAGLIVYLSSNHELWRDEVRALSIAGDSTSIADLLSRLRNEGHPVLWYLLLLLGYWLFPHAVVLKAASIAVAALAAYILLSRAPFPLFVKIMFLLGCYPVYEYSVMCRNYGLGMLFLFLFCALYRQRFSRPLLAAVVLCLLAHTSMFGAVLSAGLIAMLSVETIVRRRELSSHRQFGLLTCLALSVLGILLAVLQMKPDATSVVTPLHSLRLFDVKWALFYSFLSHGSLMRDAFVCPYRVVMPLFFAVLYLLMLRKPSIAAYLFAVVLGMELVFRLVYPLVTFRHQGFMYLAVFSAIWLSRVSGSEILKESLVMKRFEPVRQGLLSSGLLLLLSLQIYAGYRLVMLDILYPMSNAQAFGAYVGANPGLADAIILAEPDFTLDTLPYYLNNRLYFARERQFAKYVSFTTKAEREMSLAYLLNAARYLREHFKVPVLLLLPPKLPLGGVLPMAYGKRFVFSANDIGRLVAEAERLKVFGGAVFDENYAVFRLRPQMAAAAHSAIGRKSRD